MSTSDTFAKDVNVSVDLKLGLPLGKDAKLDFGANSGFSNTSADTKSETITKSLSLEFKLNGGADGIDHGEDQFILILNPAVGVAQVQVDAGNNVCRPIRVAQWAAGLSALGPSHSTSTEDLETIYAKWLINPASMPANVANDLKALGFTTEDFNALLALDPFASGATTIDNTRYIPTTWSFPYQAPLTDPSCNGGVCPCLSKSETITNTLQDTHTQEAKASISVGFKEEASGIDIGIFQFGTQIDEKFTWTHSSSNSNMQGSNQSANVTIACPSPAYTGAPHVLVYWDTLFGSFMFAPPPGDGSLLMVQRGRVLREAGMPARHVPVQMEFHGKVYHTYTNNQGEYAIYSTDNPPDVTRATVTVGSNKTVVQIGPSITSTIRIP